MQTVHQYVLEPVKTGNLEETAIAQLLEVIQTVLGSVNDLERFSVVVERMLAERFSDYNIGTRVAGMRKNIFIMIRFRGVKVKVEDLVAGVISPLPQYNDNLLIKAKFQGVRSLQDLAAHQVACSIRNNMTCLEHLPIPNLTKKVVAKFVETGNMPGKMLLLYWEREKEKKREIELRRRGR
eukprot:GFUD01031613.1.p1 GENE.GFUD01031613.1~~GFUD01031613.1.p1  ORF type:complete len:181 (+),score=56.78 GFUD01031613.1:54-596(+)